jgi:hypothetical protein
MKKQKALSSPLSEKPVHDLHQAVLLHVLSGRRSKDDSMRSARDKRITRQYKEKGLDFSSLKRSNREVELLTRKKFEQLEEHQGFMNQFSFEPCWFLDS